MKRNLIVLSCLLVLLAFNGSQAMAVDVYGEGAYSDTNKDVQVCIYADIDGSQALRSFGVKLIYDPGELNYISSTKNDGVWYLKDEGGDLHKYGDPEDVGGAVVIIGGVLDPNANPDKVSGNRVLLGTVWFARPSGSGPLTHDLTLELGKDAPYANFVVGPNPADVLDLIGVTFIDHGDGAAKVKVRERGDANGDHFITSADMFAIQSLIGGNMYKCFADCNADGYMTSADMFCVSNKIN
ncbi:MAG: hypothetical protein C4B58_15740 [Deltaproteobacteria bacterium]|nr:MAG: hypothetical protein C4B58_15740 [Deltaproteobacteria bacterium]